MITAPAETKRVQNITRPKIPRFVLLTAMFVCLCRSSFPSLSDHFAVEVVSVSQNSTDLGFSMNNHLVFLREKVMKYHVYRSGKLHLDSAQHRIPTIFQRKKSALTSPALLLFRFSSPKETFRYKTTIEYSSKKKTVAIKVLRWTIFYRF